MKDCRDFPGRLRDLCEGRGRDGRPNPTQDAIDSFWNHYKDGVTLPPTATATAGITAIPSAVSKIGDKLQVILERRADAPIPCSACKAAIKRLNNKTVDEVRAIRAEVVADIMSRAVKSAKKFWQKVVIVADKLAHTHLVDEFIGECVDEACNLEEQENLKNAV